ncbi:uncharacterized protein LOC143240752 isoform X2 [Tachypleus tridentatus]|uniref:uncharacterized protein LOC143240752 isoform X2 n=1 Tax=Tachypleus tridentatus TaxID=6853 RepID=UPI003FD67E24
MLIGQGLATESNQSEVEKLFSKVLTVTIKEGGATQGRKSRLLISVERCIISSPLSRKELTIRLIDDIDPFFLYVLTLTEEDFHSLKSQQGLLVDFAAFPQKLIDLLELCEQEEDKDLPKFLLSLNLQGRTSIDHANLDIIETNPFKHLTHLNLKLAPASDVFVKKHMVSCLKKLKDEKEQLETRLFNTETEYRERLQQCQHSLSVRTKELELLKEQTKAEITELKLKHQEELSDHQEKNRKIQREADHQLEQEKIRLEETYKKQKQQLETRISLLDSLNKDLQEKLHKSDSTIRELRSRISTLEEELQHFRHKSQMLTKENNKISTDNQDLEKTVGQLKTQLSSLEQDGREKEQLLSYSQEQLRIVQEERKKIEETAEQRRITLNKRESSLKTLSDEVMKGNEIITKLQSEIRNYHAKLKLRNKITAKQEEILGDREKKLETLQEEISVLKSAGKDKDEENNRLQQELDNVKQKLEDCQKQIRTNENVISWLNKQLNESHINTQRTQTAPAVPFQQQQYLASTPMIRPPGIHTTGVPATGRTTSVGKASVLQYNLVGLSGLGHDKTSVTSSQSAPTFNSGNGLIDPRYFQKQSDPALARTSVSTTASSSLTRCAPNHGLGFQFKSTGRDQPVHNKIGTLQPNLNQNPSHPTTTSASSTQSPKSGVFQSNQNQVTLCSDIPKSTRIQPTLMSAYFTEMPTPN